mmetsp:Transcript_23264/g.72871  ORF Transcript_23264/g.72871 Transcript_23264/m.72871 type:complete len:192 (+) Transcript_23264:40-615(+)
MLSATVVAAVVGVCWTFQHGAAPQRGTTRVWLASGYAEAVSAAEAASQKFGPTSQEAKAAWEAVSDLDDNDDQATAGIAADPAAVAAKLAELQELVSSSKPTLSALKVELSKIAGAKLFDEAAPVADASADVEALTKAAEKTHLEQTKHQHLLDEHRKYHTAVKEFHDECQKNDLLLARLHQLQAKNPLAA